MTEVETARLLVTELSPDDAVDVFHVRGDPEAMSYWDWPADSRLADTVAVVNNMVHDMNAGRAKYWTLRLRADRAFVGLCDLGDLRGDSADIGFMLVRRHWGQGLAHEAVTWVLDYARAIGLTSVHARVHDGNQRSVRLLERSGFVETQVITNFEIRPGVFRCCRLFRRVL